jgi:hypothetical protein
MARTNTVCGPTESEHWVCWFVRGALVKTERHEHHADRNFSIAILVETGATFEDLALRRAGERAARTRASAEGTTRARAIRSSRRIVGDRPRRGHVDQIAGFRGNPQSWRSLKLSNA